MGEEVFGSPGDAMQRASIVSGGDFAVGSFGLLEGEFVGVGDDAMKGRIKAAETAKIEAGQLEGGNLTGAE